MASLALTSLLESKFGFVDSSSSILSAEDLWEGRVRLSLEILQSLSKIFNNDERLKLVEEDIRITARKAEYSLEECNKQDKRVAMKMLLAKADHIYLLTIDLLKTLGPKFFNLQDQSKCVVSSAAFNSYEARHEKFRDRLCMFTSFINRVKKTEIVDYLIARFQSDLRLVAITARYRYMDKVPLARYICDDSRIKNCFPIRVWVTVFGSAQEQDLLKDLLDSVLDYFPDSEAYQTRLNEMSFKQLCQCLYEHLESQRYFIVIDNFVNAQEWDKIRHSFPDKKNGSGILFLTYRLRSGITSKPMLVLGTSFRLQRAKLFHKLVFGERGCPKQLEFMVEDILNNCEDSIYAVFMVAKFLSTINQTTDNWLIVQDSIRNNASMFRDLIPKIISGLLKALENISSTHPEETINYFQKCETKTKQPERFKHLKASSEVAEARDYEQVGLEKCLDQLVPELLQSSTQLEKVAIVGMAGIGKTTLAKRIFDDASVSSHFHIRAWIGISQFYQKRSLMIQVMQGIAQLTDNEIINATDAQLEEKVYRCLKGQRYLIIMDDMWSITAWSELMRTFPDDKLGSRILLTSRESNLIEGLNCKIVHRMSLLSDKNSWDLLQKKVFGQEICPQGFTVIGKQIAQRCNGLPLAIVVVAGILLKIAKTVDSWKVVAESVSSHVMGSEKATRTIFALSYEHLPDYLKPCFLYIGAFPGGYDIEVQRLIRLWVAEGFVASAHPKSSEDVAEEYLTDLIDRSLLLRGRRRSNGRLKTCRLHDLVLEFCVQEARNQKFLDVIKDFRLLDSETAINGHHRFSFHCHTFDDVHLTASKSLAGSALFFRVSSHLVPDILIHYFDFKLLRVLDMIAWRFDNFPVEQVAKLLLLRYLALTASFELPGTLFSLQRLQTLIINGPWLNTHKIPELPPEFWSSTSLRHLQLCVVNHLSSPEKSTDVKYINRLQTLTNITLSSCTYESFSSIPNIIKLGVCETHEDFRVVGLWDSFFQNLILLKHIKTLKISCFGNYRPLPLPSLNAFPQGLKKLTLSQSKLPWEAMTFIGDLPNLEVLKLRNNAFEGPTWETSEGGFQQLKYLLIEKSNLMYWELESDHFPRLEQLVLKSCEALEEIPIEIGDIATLTHIKVENCCSSVESSAKQIQEQCNENSQFINIQIRTHRTLQSASLDQMD